MDNNRAGIVIKAGIPERLLKDAARLYKEERLDRIHGTPFDDHTAASLVSRLNADYAISAISAEGKLLGFAAMADHDQGFWRTSTEDLPKVSGHWKHIKAVFSRAAIVGVRWHASRANRLMLDGVYVVDDAQSDGIGERLLQSVIAEARARNKARVEVFVEEPNPHVKAVYEQHGFRNRRPRSQYYVAQPGFAPFAHMMLDLD